MSDMASMKFDQQGILNVLIIPVILLTVLSIGLAAFAMWAYGQRTHYKDHSDQEVSTAVQRAITVQQKTDATQYTEAAKLPDATYIGPADFGKITVNYPKTWSAYVVEDQNSGGNNPIDGYFQLGVVPSATDPNSTFALRVQLVQSSYDSVLNDFNDVLQAKKITVTPYALPKVPSVVGSRIEGQISSTKQGVMIIVPLRNMTLKIWTESNSYKPDLDNNILQNLSFIP